MENPCDHPCSLFTGENQDSWSLPNKMWHKINNLHFVSWCSHAHCMCAIALPLTIFEHRSWLIPPSWTHLWSDKWLALHRLFSWCLQNCSQQRLSDWIFFPFFENGWSIDLRVTMSFVCDFVCLLVVGDGKWMHVDLTSSWCKLMSHPGVFHVQNCLTNGV